MTLAAFRTGMPLSQEIPMSDQNKQARNGIRLTLAIGVGIALMAYFGIMVAVSML